jgi:CobQ/CobB/MinD/ParA nucleotide binding domain
MRTITYYSYKGGVGRTLLVANTARYLSTLGKTVFALDLDLEAPGLHYKFELGSEPKQLMNVAGIVDILVRFLKQEPLPESFDNYISHVEVVEGAGSIHVMRAGTAPSGEYWRLLSQVNWYEMFYGPKPTGVPFFLELKERIRLHYNPDFLLIDARTGITEMGGIATTLLPDSVVCLALTSVEHLEGLRAVMHGIKQTSSREGAPVQLLPVISRLSQRKDEDSELATIRTYLNSPIKEGGPSLDLDELMTLHTEPLLDSREQLLVGGKNSPHDLPLLRDYLRLFSKIIPAEDIQPHVGQLIQRAVSRLLDDPDTAQSELEALTTYCADQDAYRALLKLYQVRRTPIEKTVATASLMWQLGGSRAAPDQLLVDIVRAGFSEPRPGDFQKKHAEFAEAIWRAGDMKDFRIGLTLVAAYLPESRERAVQLLSDYIGKVSPPHESAVIRLIELLRSSMAPQKAFPIINRFKETIQAPEFHASWARLVVDQKDLKQATTLLEDPSFRQEAVRAADAVTLYRLYKMVGDEAAGQLLNEVVGTAISNEEIGPLRTLAEVFGEEGRLPELEAKLVTRFPGNIIEEIIEGARRRLRRGRLVSARYYPG